MDERGFTLTELLASLAVILLLALVVPALAATAVARSRIARADADVRRIADTLRRAWPDGLSLAGTRDAIEVLAGSGSLPIVPPNTPWTGRVGDLGRAVADPGSGARDVPGLASGPDPWGNAYLVNLGAAGAVWVLSAGPNGRVETVFDQCGDKAALGGDDVGVRVR